MNHKAISFSIVLLFGVLLLSAQSTTTYYFAKDGTRCTKDAASTYMKTKLLDPSTQRYSFQHYTIDDTLLSRGYYLNNILSDRTGTYTEFYKNGNRKTTGSYLTYGKDIVGQRVNTWHSWYENGSILSEKIFSWDSVTNLFTPYIITFWDTAGVKKVIDGTGEYSYEESYTVGLDSTSVFTFSGNVKLGLKDGRWKGYYPDGTLYCEETYNQEGLIEGKSYDPDGASYAYNKVQVNPEFNGGDSALVRFLQKNIRYPLYERENGTQGRVCLRFVVDTAGKVKDTRIIDSVSLDLDKEALRVVNLIPDFKPALLRGKLVSVFFNLPIVFRLQ